MAPGAGPYPALGVLGSAVAIAAALTTGAPALGPLGHLSLGVTNVPRAADLSVRAYEGAPAAPRGPLALDGGPRSGQAPPPCAGDVCQPAVEVPGVELRPSRPSRNELVLGYLSRAHVEPFATVLRAIVESGLNLDYTPPMFDGGIRGWGSVMLRLKWRLDARNAPVFRRVPR